MRPQPVCQPENFQKKDMTVLLRVRSKERFMAFSLVLMRSDNFDGLAEFSEAIIKVSRSRFLEDRIRGDRCQCLLQKTYFCRSSLKRRLYCLV